MSNLEEKRPIYKNWWFYIAIIVLVIPYIFMFSTLIKPSFDIMDYSITSDTTDYTGIQNTTTYKGKGFVTTSDKKGVYIVALKQTLISGGGEDTEKESVGIVIVGDGKGEFSTYDYGDVGDITKPNYEFEIIGSKKIN